MAQCGHLTGKLGVHLADELANDAPHTFHLFLRSALNESIQRLGQGIHGAADGHFQRRGHPVADRFGNAGQPFFFVLLLADQLHLRQKGTGHGQLIEGFVEAVQRPACPAHAHAVEHIEQKRAGNARHGGGEGKAHPGQQQGNAVHRALRVGKVDAGQALHQADEGAQNAQRGQQTGDEFRQLGMAGLIDHTIFIYIVFDIAGHSTHIQLPRVQQEFLPFIAERTAEEARLPPRGPLIISGCFFQFGYGTVQQGAVTEHGIDTFTNAHQHHQCDGAVDQKIHQIRSQQGQKLLRHSPSLRKRNLFIS